MTAESSPRAYDNLDALCAQAASQMVGATQTDDLKTLEGTTRNALAVMREQGLYAFYIFLRNKSAEGGEQVWKLAKQLWQNQALGPLLPERGSADERIIALTQDLDDLLLARQLAERALVYALYGLRAERKRAEVSQRATGG